MFRQMLEVLQHIEILQNKSHNVVLNFRLKYIYTYIYIYVGLGLFFLLSMSIQCA